MSLDLFNGRCVAIHLHTLYMIPEAWANYFADLASPPNLDYDPENSLKRNKAAGPDELDPEHLRFGGEQLMKVLTLLFNSMVLAGHIPPSFCP